MPKLPNIRINIELVPSEGFIQSHQAVIALTVTYRRLLEASYPGLFSYELMDALTANYHRTLLDRLPYMYESEYIRQAQASTPNERTPSHQS